MPLSYCRRWPRIILHEKWQLKRTQSAILRPGVAPPDSNEGRQEAYATLLQVKKVFSPVMKPVNGRCVCVCGNELSFHIIQ